MDERKEMNRLVEEFINFYNFVRWDICSREICIDKKNIFIKYIKHNTKMINIKNRNSHDRYEINNILLSYYQQLKLWLLVKLDIIEEDYIDVDITNINTVLTNYKKTNTYKMYIRNNILNNLIDYE